MEAANFIRLVIVSECKVGTPENILDIKEFAHLLRCIFDRSKANEHIIKLYFYVYKFRAVL